MPSTRAACSLNAQLILPFAAAESARPHYELLLRMIDESGQTVGPDSFMSAAKRYQLMPVIDRWVINHVIEALQPRASVLEGQRARVLHQLLRPVAQR